MTCGIVFYLVAGGRRGKHHAVQLAVAIHSLRQRTWRGQVHLVVGDDPAEEIGKRLCQCADAQPFSMSRDIFRPDSEKCYSAKLRCIEHSPFDFNIFCDADLVFLGDIQEVFPVGTETVFTQFADWVTSGRIIHSRIEAWRPQAPEVVDMAHSKQLPAINTGVFGWATNSPFCEVWQQLCAKDPKRFLGDETAATALLASHLDTVRIVDRKYNASVVYDRNCQDVRVWHSHGDKFLSKGRDIFQPAFQAAAEDNFAGIREWARSLCPQLPVGV